MRKILFLIGLCIHSVSYTQAKYPTDYFTPPLKIPLILSGTFGELRTNHFHSGLDIKTQQRTGLSVHASAEGYVSRIKISHWGYGKALYITHPNGYTTVYGHLKKFNPTIEAYIKKQQYAKKTYEIELFPKPSDLIVKKQEVVAYSGNSGSSGGPHLHFEIRDRNARPMNPMLFGINIIDSKAPEIRAGVVYAFGDSSHVNQSNAVKTLAFKRNAKGQLIATPIEAYGTIGIGVNTVDKQDGALNNNGVYTLEMAVNGRKVFNRTVNLFSFSETRYINTLIDYSRNYYKKQRIQRCFVTPANKLSIYSDLVENGYLTIEDGLSYTVQIKALDFKGNTTELIIPITGKKHDEIKKVPIKKTPHYFKRTAFNKVSDSIVSVAFPSGSFYEDLYFDFSFKNNIARLHNPSVALHKNFTLTFDISHYPTKGRDKMYIGRIGNNGRISYVSTQRKADKVFTNSRDLGNYTLAYDSIPPVVTPINFKKDQWLSKYSYLKFKISDRHSGIKSYSGEIDGKWVLFEYEPKLGTLVFDFDDISLPGTKHTLKLVVKDNLNNTNTYITTFNKKE
ncbi:M23 family metallopeptidase [Flavobacteriaceae bacterium F08102]|nr:M23 family metallopeptidase [Flavobacteriaceae bacterium F08102]